MATTDNYQAIMKSYGIDCYYDVIKKRIEINIPNFKPIADLKDEAHLVELENLCIKNFIPHQRVRDAMKIIAQEVNPVARWIDSKPWDGVSRIADFCDTVSSEDTVLKNMLMRKWSPVLCGGSLRGRWRITRGVVSLARQAGTR
jgi:putative DNA primase/helicase